VSLLDELVGAQLVIVDAHHRLAYTWFGGAGVNVYDDEGREVHYFTIGTKRGERLTPAMVRAAIDRVRAENDE
jgi:hypothetical protein